MLIWPKKQNIIKHENLLLHIRMGKEIFTFGNIGIEKKIFLLQWDSYIFTSCRHWESISI